MMTLLLVLSALLLLPVLVGCGCLQCWLLQGQAAVGQLPQLLL